MLIYHYHPVTGVFLGQSLADESPLEPGVFLVPAYATATPPPETGNGEYACWENDAWSVKIEETIDPDPEPEEELSVPVSITPRQGMIMLSRAGLLAPVNAAIDAIGGQSGEEARIDFERATEWRRDWPLLNAIAGGIGLTSAQVDDLFIAASQI